MAYDVLEITLGSLTVTFFILGIIFHILTARLRKKKAASIVSILGMKEMINKKKI